MAVDGRLTGCTLCQGWLEVELLTLDDDRGELSSLLQYRRVPICISHAQKSGIGLVGFRGIQLLRRLHTLALPRSYQP